MQPTTKAILAGTALFVALVSLWGRLHSPLPKVNPAIHTGLGQVLAQEASQAVHDRGQIVAVIADAHKQSGTFLHAQWQAFTGELKKHPAMSLAAPEIANPGSHVPLGEILDRHAQASGIVFFVDPPDSIDLEAVANRPAVPKLVVVGNPDLPVKNYYGKFFASGTLAALIIQQTTPASPPAVKPKTPREWFDRYYELYTPQNFASLLD